MTSGVRMGAPFRRPTSGEANDASADGHTRTTGTVLAATAVLPAVDVSSATGVLVAGAVVVADMVDATAVTRQPSPAGSLLYDTYLA